MMILGLRIDVDTFRGTRTGVPRILKILKDSSVKASFFFSVGPDNMGRNLWRLLKPAFFKKMLRSNAPGLYGWDILLRGTCWPGPVIGENLKDIICSASDNMHEIGLHAWDHYTWQNHILTMDEKTIFNAILKGYEMLGHITGKTPCCSASPGWICNHKVLMEKQKFSFTYNSDCRGKSIFYPIEDKKIIDQPQIPVTLPTYDEVFGTRGITNSNYNDYILSLIKPEKLNVLTVHAEVEGIVCAPLFADFIKKAIKRDIAIVPLGQLLNREPHIGTSPIIQKKIKGRQGLIAFQREN